MTHPKIRPVEALPVEIDGEPLVYLRDPLGYASQGLLLPMPAFFIASLLDGTNSILDVQAAFARRFGELVLSDTVTDLVNQLDHHYYLEGERFTTLERETRERFACAPTRPLAHVGTCYSGDHDQLRAELDGFFTHPSGPGLPESRGGGSGLRAIIAPHIDLRVGGPCYAWAYREVAERSDAELFVLLGTSHAPGSHPFIVTRKDFETPIGTVQTDTAFIDRLQHEYGGELFRDEILHRNEHSLEFQALFLQHVFGAHRAFRIVPILVGSFHQLVAARRQPLEDPAIGSFVEALRRVLAQESRPVCLVAGVDFAHVGRKFGDPEGLDPAFLGQVDADDRALFPPLERTDAAGFFDAVSRDGDRRRICGLSPMYTLLATLGEARGRVLRYDRSDETQTQSAVSFASLAFD
jgi:AmmeMemoRadiSam system protein B